MGIISNIFGFGKAPASPNADLFAKFERSSLLMATPQQLSENRNALHDLFSSKNWENLSFEDKKAAVQALENDFSFYLLFCQQHSVIGKFAVTVLLELGQKIRNLQIVTKV